MNDIIRGQEYLKHKVVISVLSILRRVANKSLIKALLFAFVMLFSTPAHQAFAQEESPNKALDKVVLQLAWYHKFQFAGYYAAQQQGFYAEEGLAVDIRSGHPGLLPVDAVLSGEADFGTAASEIIHLRMQGKPVVALAAIMQHSPWALVALADSDISSLDDLIGKSIGINNNYRDVEVMAMLKNERLATEEITFVKRIVGPDNLINGAVDARVSYLTNLPFALLEKGKEPRSFRPGHYGIDFYGDTLFTSEVQTKQHPKRVAAFRRASLRGWQYAMEHSEEMVDYIFTSFYANKVSEPSSFSHAHLSFEAKVMAEELMHPVLIEIGHMNPHRWRSIADAYAEMGLADPLDSLEGFIYDPDPAPDYRWLFAALGLLLGVGFVGVLAKGWNKGLQRAVKERTRELNDSNKKHERLVDNLIETFLYRHDVEGVFNYVSSSITQVLGYSREEFLIHFTEHLTPHPINQDALRYTEQSISGLQSPTFEVQTRHKDGSIRWIEASESPVFDEEGKVVAVEGIAHDITRRKENETERERLGGQLRQAQKMEAVGQLAGGVAHDFNNLLQAILGYGEIAMDDIKTEDPARASVEEMLKASERAAVLVRQLLAFSRRQVLDMKDVDLNEAISDLTKMLRRVIGAHVAFEIISGHNLGIVRADCGQIGQILMNLCVNARDAMPDGGKITVETENVRIDEAFCETHPWAKQGRYVLLSVTDTGCGMDEETLASAFEPFFTTKKVGDGTGLGLATVYGLVKQHDGLIHIYSELGKGSTFKIYLPLVERDAVVVGDKIEGPVPGGTETILLAEDEKAVRELTRSILENAGYTVLSACDGEEALRLFEKHADEIDIALLDVIMPKVGGRAVFERIRATHPGIHVLFCSGYSMNAIHTNFVLDEGLTLIQKPCQRNDLLRRVRKVFES